MWSPFKGVISDVSHSSLFVTQCYFVIQFESIVTYEPWT
jgi:hypothetical protein